ncbi:DUF2957 domain-containing protein [Burkholderia gladioli]|uniref:DUF2957 domain-containing protein n=1 Tax=Burkholderia gladioli TaxID=28095 RepID=UPI0016401B66|nr:DUF2957 domain-containing protein [Burkholderia gladioli]
MFRNTKPRMALLSCFALAMPFFAGCGGGDGGDPPAAIQVPQCSGSSCPASGSTTQPSTPNALCPSTLDYSTVYTGGSGSGEYVRVRFDTTKLTYQMDFILSSVPVSAGQINNTRAGQTITGTFHRATNLPTAAQNQCAFVLDNGASADGSYSITVNPADAPTLFVGNGVVGGGIPGATIAFPGITLAPGITLGSVPSRSFDFFPYIGFTDTETDFTKVAGNYNELGIHLSPTGTGYQTAQPQGWQPDVINWNETLNADGSCSITAGSDYSCHTTGTPWTLRTNADGSADNVFVSKPTSAGTAYTSAGQGQPIVLLAPSQAQGIMIVGKLRGALIPIVIRVGYASTPPGDLLDTVADAEIGISALAPATPIAANSLTGGFIGATSASACGIVANNGPSSSPAVSSPGFDATKPHPNLPGVYANGNFDPSAGNCLDGTAVSTYGANYTSTLFSGATAAFVNPLTSLASSTFSLDYTQATPGLVKVTALQDFNAVNTAGNVAIFKQGATGWAIKVGEVYAMVVNDSQFNPFFTVGAFVQ